MNNLEPHKAYKKAVAGAVAVAEGKSYWKN
jgi:hypothetical protein